jgi:DNA (cytosine-5)-methyltransferase 1
MFNRPIVHEAGGPRLIKGFDSSYRRMNPDRPSATITTNTSHVGSDIKIHPWENRVLSVLECADLQTVPRFYDWSRAFAEKRAYLVRNVIGEAFPSFFTYLHGKVLGALLDGTEATTQNLVSYDSGDGKRVKEGVEAKAGSAKGPPTSNGGKGTKVRGKSTDPKKVKFDQAHGTPSSTTMT